MPDAVERFAPAKVNLALHVLGRRPDGYHDLDTLAVFADIGDRVRVRAADALTLTVSGPFAGHAPAGEDNLVMRAARLLKERAGAQAGAEILLEKHLPAGAGFGGGSADAAATLHALGALWRLELSLEELLEIAGGLGADVPMCLVARALRAQGKGERIDLIDGWPALPLVLTWPGRMVATVSVFAALTRRECSPLPVLPAAAGPAAAADWLARCRNDLEAPAMSLAPEISDLLDGLRGTKDCLLARMSGSGSGCFGVYGSHGAALAAARSLVTIRPDWWVRATQAGHRVFDPALAADSHVASQVCAP